MTLVYSYVPSLIHLVTYHVTCYVTMCVAMTLPIVQVSSPGLHEVGETYHQVSQTHNGVSTNDTHRGLVVIM